MSALRSSTRITVSASLTPSETGPATGRAPKSRVTVRLASPSPLPGPRPQPAAASAAPRSSAIATAVPLRPSLKRPSSGADLHAHRKGGGGDFLAVGGAEFFVGHQGHHRAAVGSGRAGCTGHGRPLDRLALALFVIGIDLDFE